ncbi:MAG TPA: CapA family protein, partial [Bacteroidales bacterium]|nr:CapA family protein [Bacteroidales bacterium]
LLLFVYPAISGQDTTNYNVIRSDTISIIATGDIMMGTSFPDPSYLPPGNNPYPLLSSVIQNLADADLTFGNLEGPFSDDARLVKKCRDTTLCYAFRVPEKYAGVLDSAGYDLISIANNHIGDFGYPAKETTAYLLDSLGISYAGTSEYPWSIRRIRDSILVGFCAFAPNKGCLNFHDKEKAMDIIRMLSDSCDITVVSIHGGAEGADNQNVTREEEFYYGENRGNIYEFAHKAIDNGADVILGHGPHVSRAVEVYKNRFISYSLGNFCTYRRFNLRGPNGYAPMIKVSIDPSGSFLEGRILPVYQDLYGHVKPDPQKRAIFKVRELTKTDFPDSVIVINDEGYIKLIPSYGSE